MIEYRSTHEDICYDGVHADVPDPEPPEGDNWELVNTTAALVPMETVGCLRAIVIWTWKREFLQESEMERDDVDE